MNTGRHRLCRGGHRKANSALYRSVIVRMRFHQPSIDYVARRTAKGQSKREIIRCLKRYLARAIYQRVMTDHRPRAGASKVATRLVLTYRGVNALAEVINGLYKTELIRGPGQGPWKTIEDVELATLGWVHWHNTERLYGYLGDVPPAESEAAYAAQQADHDLVAIQ